MAEYFVYIDWTCEVVPRPFYVGKGTASRVSDVFRRNRKHQSVRSKYGIRREVFLGTRDESYALEVEKQLISELSLYVYGSTHNGIGCNMTLGGEGLQSEIWTPERRARVSAARKGKPLSEDHRKKIGQAVRQTLSIDSSKMSRTFSDDSKAMISVSMKRVWADRRRASQIAIISRQENDSVAS